MPQKYYYKDVKLSTTRRGNLIRKSGKRLNQTKLSLPKIGIFWILKGSVLAHGEPLKKVRAVNGKKGLDIKHILLWENFRKLMPDLRQFEYDEILRGRIIYDIAENTYTIYLGQKMMKRTAIVEAIIRRFNLNGEKVSVRADDHYQSYTGMIL